MTQVDLSQFGIYTPNIGAPPSINGGKATTGIKYLGDVPHARIAKRGPFGMAMGPITTPGYVKGDQVKLLPHNGPPLASLQQALYQAGYLTDAQYNHLVLGSPDQVTTAAFAKLLATSNMTGTNWSGTLSQRLADAAAQAPAGNEDASSIPPLTVSLSDPADIKSAISHVAKTLYGGDLPDDEVASMVSAFQDKQRQSQTTAYYQQYDPNGGKQGTGGYGPGGEALAAPDASSFVEQRIKEAHPDQVAKVEFSGTLSNALSSMAKTGGGLM